PRLPEQAPTGLQAVIDGALRYDPAAGWDGELRAELGLPGEEPTAATLTLSGGGPEVAFALAATGPLRSALRVSGTLAPEPRLTGDAVALADAVRAADAGGRRGPRWRVAGRRHVARRPQRLRVAAEHLARETGPLYRGRHWQPRRPRGHRHGGRRRWGRPRRGEP